MHLRTPTPTLIAFAALVTSLIAGLIAGLLVLATSGPAAAQLPAQESTPAPGAALAALVFPGTKSAPAQFGVYLGDGLVLTNWHPWTLDGRDYTSPTPALAPNKRIPRYDADSVDDPGETLFDAALCGETWVYAAAKAVSGLGSGETGCMPFVRLDGAGFLFPLAGDSRDAQPVAAERLIYASRQYDIALIAVDAADVEARGVRPARLSMAPTRAEQVVIAAHTGADGSPTLQTVTLARGTAETLPPFDGPRGTGPWRVASLVIDSGDLLAEGGPVFDAATGDLLGLAWRAGRFEDQPQTWITPAALWIHDLHAAAEESGNLALRAALDAAATAPTTAATTLGDPLAPPLGNAGIDVQHVALDLAIDPDARMVNGTATLTIRATMHQLSTFSLDAHALNVQSVEINGEPVPFVEKAHKLIIDLREPQPFGAEFYTRIIYEAAPQPYRSPYLPFFDIGMFFTNGQVSTLNEPDGAHTWFPCNDHPSDRARYDIRLVVPAPLTAISNGELIAITEEPGDKQAFHWHMRHPMATYLVVVAVANYTAIGDATANGIPITHYVYPDQVMAGEQVFSYTAEALVQQQALYGPYPFDSYGHVVVPEHGMALETQTMTTMPDTLLEGSELAAFNLVVHEIAHHWFGNTVTPATWSDIWLNEGFATHAEWLALEKRFGEQAAIAARSSSEQALITDGRTTPLIDPAPDELLSLASYDKGAWLLHMLRREIGDEMFLALLQTYVQVYRETPAGSLDFWLLAEQISSTNLRGFFTQWLLQGGIPRYTLYWTETGSGADVLLCPTGTGNYAFNLPLRFTNGDQRADLPLDTAAHGTPAAYDLAFAPTGLQADPDQNVLAQVEVRPIAALPDSCGE